MRIQKINTAYSRLMKGTKEILATPIRAYRIHQYNNGSFTNGFDISECFDSMSIKRAILKFICCGKN